MNLIGIDYGTKRVGVAVADRASGIATPLAVLDVAGKQVEEIVAMVMAVVAERDAKIIVIGESKDFSGAENAIMKKIHLFAEALAKRAGEGVKIIFEPEFLTSHHAQRFQGKNDLLDASAAALILQSYLDRQ